MGVRAASLSLGALFVGSVIVVDPAGLAPFGPAKWGAISTLALVGGGLALRSGGQQLHRPSMAAWTALLLLLSAGAVFGHDLPTALLGQPDRHLGLLTWLLFLLMFCAGQQLIDDVDRAVIARSAVVATLCLGAWCAWELAFGAPVGIDSNTSRLTGSFGSAAFLGAAACLLVPISAGVALTPTAPRGWRVAAALSAALGTMALIGSGARAAWLAVAVVLVVAVARGRPTRRVLLAGAAVLLVGVACVVPRLGDVLGRSDGAGSRVDEWAVATRVIGAHPMVGVGPEGYRIAVSEGIDGHYERSYGRDRVLPDRAHSGPLDVSLDGGIAAGLLYCALIGFVCRRALRLVRHSGPTMTGIAVGTITYAIQQLLLFPLAELDPLWWLSAGIVVSAGSPVARVSTARSWAAVVALAVAPVALIGGVLDVAADRLAHDALSASDPSAAISSAARAVRLRPDNLRYRAVDAQVLADRGTLADVDAAIRQTDSALGWSSRDPIAADQRATLLLRRAGITGQRSDVLTALVEWKILVDRDPLRAQWQVQLGRAAAAAGDLDLARASWTVAADLSPDDSTAADLLQQLGAP
jgi:O-antigen ligase